MKQMISNKGVLLSITLIVSCCTNTSKVNDYNILNYKDKFSITVKKIDEKNNYLILNDSFIIDKENNLIFENYTPKWLFEKKAKIENKIIYPTLFDIKEPYKILKDENSNLFQLIKNKDTMNFYLAPIYKTEW